jgi:hypothetical protein
MFIEMKRINNGAPGERKVSIDCKLLGNIPLLRSGTNFNRGSINIWSLRD